MILMVNQDELKRRTSTGVYFFKSFNEKIEVAIGEGLVLYMIRARQSSCFAMFSVVYFLLKI